MSLPLTLALLFLFARLAVFCGWRGSRPPDLARGPRLIPWRPLMLGGVMMCLFLVIHLINLAGFDTSAAGPRF